jgi:hypothetical protein
MRTHVSKKRVPLLILGCLLACFIAGTAEAGVDVGVNINIGPPPITVAAPPAVVLVPGSQVYFVPGVEFDVFFHNGYWWSPRGNRWYRARYYNGPWGVVDRRYVPPPVRGVPHDYRHVYVKERHIPYGQWKKDRARHERMEHREMREHERREHREMREHERREHRDEHGGGGHGRGH